MLSKSCDFLKADIKEKEVLLNRTLSAIRKMSEIYQNLL